MEAQRIRDGVKLMQEGDKASSKGLFRKPDWDVAAGCYERAATSFKIAKSYEQAVQAYGKASEALFKTDALHLAGKAMESAALILAQNLNQPQRAAEAYQKASDLFMTQGSIDRAAEQLEKAGRALENIDVNAAIEMYSSACGLYEQEDRGRFAIDIFKKAISLLVKSKKYAKAVDMLHRQSVILQKLSSRTHIYKANLSIIILLLAIGDDVEAGKQFNAMCNEESDISQCLLQAYEDLDQELLEKTVRRQQVTFLDNEIVKLARTLTVPGEGLTGGTTPGPHNQYAPPRETAPSPRSPPISRASPRGNVHDMSPAQVRAELYGSQSTQEPSSHRSPAKEEHAPPPPYTTGPHDVHPSADEKERFLDEEFARLNMKDEKPKPVTATTSPAPAPAPAPRTPVSPPAKHEEDDDDEGLC
ncbi:uncharacterized protein BYT42DRAFT_493520 [Radiomyces spectabilis]|uniref:uncharacterized protein n=1 Tax=Radiomyces spectabilis TaxID=64574 RepID=UPI00221E910E|nr:uncharacterized protein BYT42DRAFT_493520 [Radiomyces spectabilis]KAI8384375.1 hypothetical protein BYT42DRAFT_493520 [Radiomyces spectabilis]